MMKEQIQDEINYFRTHVLALTQRDNGTLLVKDNPQASGFLKRVGREISYVASGRGIKLKKASRLAAISRLVGRDKPIASTKDLTTGELRLLYACVVNGADQEDFYNLLFALIEEVDNANQ